MIGHPARALSARRKSSVRRYLRPHTEVLETRLALSWTGVPPTGIAPPSNALPLNLNSQGDATGAASITSTEVDYYTFTAPISGAYRIATQTPASNLDTVLGVFSAAGTRITY